MLKRLAIGLNFTLQRRVWRSFFYDGVPCLVSNAHFSTVCLESATAVNKPFFVYVKSIEKQEQVAQI